MQSTNQLNSQRRRRSGLGPLLVSVILVVLSAALWLNRQYVIDSAHFWQFKPSDAVARVADRISLTDSGKFLFYASRPSIEAGATFNDVCDRKEQQTAVLGCYAANRIYIYDVTDARLDGIEEVTAAHEMLHAAYERLSATEKARVNELLEPEYQKLQQDPAFADRMAFYARTEPGERYNELHSIIGTEIAGISGDLAAHYGRYFTDRDRIVKYYATYHEVFEGLETQTKELGKELDGLNERIKAASARYNEDATRLKDDIASFNERANAGGFASQSQFDRERSNLIARVDKLNSDRDAINAQVDEYNSLRETYNATVTQSNELYESIDSSLAPAPKV